MAATPKKQAKVQLNYSIDKEVYDFFVKTCSKKGYAPNVIVEQFMKKYNETGQV